MIIVIKWSEIQTILHYNRRLKKYCFLSVKENLKIRKYLDLIIMKKMHFKSKIKWFKHQKSKI